MLSISGLALEDGQAIVIIQQVLPGDMGSRVDASEVLRYARALMPIVLSHHPDCSFFHGDTIPLPFSRYRLCLGCSVSYPLAFLLPIVALLTGWYERMPDLILPNGSVLAAGVILCLPQIAKYAIVRGGKLWRVTVKLSLGMGLGCGILWVLILPIPVVVRVVVLIAIVISVLFLGSVRYNYIRRICSSCIYHGDWDICYGFRRINLYCSLGNRRGPLLQRTILDIRTKRRMLAKQDGPPGRCDDQEPPLTDGKIWILDDPAYVVPWLPRTGLEAGMSSDIPR